MHAEADSSFDAVVEELQRLIDEQMRAAYSPQVIEEWSNPRNLGRMMDCSASSVVLGWCGDTMEIFLKIDDGTIAKATFMTDGCGPTVACGSRLTRMLDGLPLRKALELIPDDLLEELGGLPADSTHCAQLAINTLHEALARYEPSQPAAEASHELE